MKINWGQGLFIAMTAFILFIVFLSIQLMRSNSSVEHEDYYIRGLNYENTLAQERRTAPYIDSIDVRYAGGQLKINFPSNLQLPLRDMRIHMYRPSSSDLDKTINLNEKVSNRDTRVEVGKLKHGSWQARLHWVGADDSLYFVEKPLFVQ